MILEQYWTCLVHGGGKVDEELIALEVMRYMGGWDWKTYLEQPDWLIDLIKGKMNMDQEFKKFQAKQ